MIMQLEQRFIEIQNLLTIYSPLISQWDEDVLKGEGLVHPWIDKVSTFSEDELLEFDAKRNHKLLDNPEWLELVDKIKKLTSFKSVEPPKEEITTLGNIKKRHELNRLNSTLAPLSESSTLDFGGGVGNLAHHLEKNYNMNVLVIDSNPELIDLGKKKLSKLNSSVTFKSIEITNKIPNELAYASKDLAIGLHTCGNFANNMLRTCVKNKIPTILNFGCCYSKILDDDYHLSSLANKRIKFNRRALAISTLGFSQVPTELVRYRYQIIDYKYSFYHWNYRVHNILEFKPMGNSRRSLYGKTFSEFVITTLNKYYPQLSKPKPDELDIFYRSQENIELLKYLKSYYAIARYIGELLEAYILCDRALYLEENGYQANILEVFDPTISPRNKLISALRVDK